MADPRHTTPDFELIAAADCPLCGRSAVLVVPDYCSDHTPDHGNGHSVQDCPERMCLACGGALFVDPVVVVRADRTA